MKRRQPEFLLHCVVADHLRKNHPSLVWFHPANGEARTAQAGARLKRMGVRAGTPDILIFWESNHYPCIGAIELKASAGKLSDTQTTFMRDWTAIGGQYAVCKSLDEVKTHLACWGVS